MERLTDRKTAADLKANAESLRAAGLEPSEMDKRYIKLAEYENEEERNKADRVLPTVCCDGYLMRRFLETR